MYKIYIIKHDYDKKQKNIMTRLKVLYDKKGR